MIVSGGLLYVSSDPRDQWSAVPATLMVAPLLGVSRIIAYNEYCECC